MASDPSAAAVPQTAPVTITSADGQRAVLDFRGALDAHMVRELEERFADPRLTEARTWVLNMHNLTRIDLACAYALLRAATMRPDPVAITVRGARRNVHRTLREVAFDAVAAFQD
ncbi:STAS domain-containing protein [Streptomyces ficellus]|uniref:STAS domain-containing protein n=1 Tax=Streptomyces ficellus TaxID=1977088 RepID=A0ABT7ZBM8_9ACTN|nr:STAS domain-containing protein [Streptomyces ficellus]MDN3296836.1 STAS domain-containing protein [Streptomyces ficellus]